VSEKQHGCPREAVVANEDHGFKKGMAKETCRAYITLDCTLILLVNKPEKITQEW
jgi:hypothetical protein